LVWIIGTGILFSLVFFPTLGIHLFWNILIPVAPALLVVAVGVWRNVCPMASNALFVRHMGKSKRIKLTLTQSSKLNLIAVISLFILVPWRHAIFDTNGLATAILILSLAVVAVIMGFFFEWKSGWCSGLCPVHPVEKLYGINNRLTLPNAHCDSSRCVTPCPDSTPGINPMSLRKTKHDRIAGFLMVAAFPGFIWGWFQVPDYMGLANIEEFITLYKMPLIGMLISCASFLILKKFIEERTLIALFSASAVSCYYWFRLPALIGFGVFPNDGMLVNLSNSIPKWSITAVVIATTLFFFWWIVARKKNQISWAKRPPYADKLKSRTQIKPT
jgi:hypothetical protein